MRRDGERRSEHTHQDGRNEMAATVRIAGADTRDSEPLTARISHAKGSRKKNQTLWNMVKKNSVVVDHDIDDLEIRTEPAITIEGTIVPCC